MDPGKITENIIRLREDVAEIKQKLNSDFADIHAITASIQDHERRLSHLETETLSTRRSWAVVGTILFNLLTLAVAILSIVHKTR